MILEMSAGEFEDILTCAEATTESEAALILKPDRWLMKTVTGDSTLMHAALIKKSVMEEYDPRGVEYAPLEFDPIKDFIDSRGENLRIELEGRSMHLYQGSDHIELATPDIENIQNKDPDMPDLDHEAIFTVDPDVIFDFNKKVKRFQDNHYLLISPRDDKLYLYSDHDNWRLDRSYNWDDIVDEDDLEIDWSINNTGPEGSIVPSEEKGVDCLVASEWMNGMDVSAADEVVTFYVGNHQPLRVVFDTEAGVKMSYMLAPRLPSNADGLTNLPDRVKE